MEKPKRLENKKVLNTDERRQIAINHEKRLTCQYLFFNFVVYLNFVFWALYVKIKRKGNQKKLSTFFLILYQHVLLLETLFHINNWLQLQIITTHYLKCSANKKIIF